MVRHLAVRGDRKPSGTAEKTESIGLGGPPRQRCEADSLLTYECGGNRVQRSALDYYFNVMYSMDLLLSVLYILGIPDKTNVTFKEKLHTLVFVL